VRSGSTQPVRNRSSGNLTSTIFGAQSAQDLHSGVGNESITPFLVNRQPTPVQLGDDCRPSQPVRSPRAPSGARPLT